ncbi:MAG: LysM peptidoglycan-binding domain-containing protein [Microscillaceae bacterium]|nr:LysM peptidoglycan-binding domain-containing protein [Microscillaceae bacterium]
MTYTVQSGDSLYSIARKFNTSVQEIIRLNNLPTSLVNVGQVLNIGTNANLGQAKALKHIVHAGESLYSIAKEYNLTVAELKQLNRLVSSNLRVGQELIVSAPAPLANTQPKIAYHRVASEDTLYSIARQYRVEIEDLIKWNQLASNHLAVGQNIRVIPPDKTATEATQKEEPFVHTVVWGDSLYAIARKYNTTVAKILEINQLESHYLHIGQTLIIPQKTKNDTQTINNPANTSEKPENPELHIVVAGESLYAIARQYGLSLNYLRQINQLSSDLLRVGQVLKVYKEKIKETDSDEKPPLEPIPTPNPSPEPPKINMNTQDDPNTVYPDPINLPSQIQAVLDARKIFQLEAQSGVDIFGDGMRGPVGRNHVNRPEDLEKVQRRLIQLNILPANHTESPSNIRQSLGVGAITANLIPKTIEAIEKFQQKFQVHFWIEHSTRVAMMQTSSYTPGVVVPDDITYRFLREFTEYKLSFPHPHTHEPTTVKFQNFPRSAFTAYYHGVSYVGSSNPEIPLSVFQKLGLGKDLAAALKYVSRHEGNFDAINSYDSAVFSYGFIQFAGNGGGLAPLLATIKSKAPKVFEEYFQKFGIDVSYTLFDGQIRSAQIQVVNPYDPQGRYLAQGLEAEKHIRDHKQLYGIFIRAGFYLPIVTLQIDAAIQSYVRPALNIKLDIVVGMLRLTQALLSDYINSPMGITLIIDTTINQWVNRTREVFRDAIEKVAIKQNLYSQQELIKIDEREVISQIIADAQKRQDMRLVQRATNILHSGLSWRKAAG